MRLRNKQVKASSKPPQKRKRPWCSQSYYPDTSLLLFTLFKEEAKEDNTSLRGYSILGAFTLLTQNPCVKLPERYERKFIRDNVLVIFEGIALSILASASRSNRQQETFLLQYLNKV